MDHGGIKLSKTSLTQVRVGGDPGGRGNYQCGGGDHRQLQLQSGRGPPVVQGLCRSPDTAGVGVKYRLLYSYMM